ncbi:MAG: DNA glycosylase AlkZ-like family protein, partial [Candidatus Hodarchaeota archaeon]
MEIRIISHENSRILYESYNFYKTRFKTLKIPTISQRELQKVTIVGCNLHQWQSKGDDGIRKVFQENGAIQLDPLNPAGRNHDLFFLARVPDYKIGQFEKVCYPEKLVFENYFSFLCAISREFFPYFHYKHDIIYLDKYTRPAIEKFNEDLPGILDAILEHVKEHGSTQGQDLAHLGRANPEFASWKSSRVSGTALEYLWRLGKLAIEKRDKNFRKVYGAIEEYFTSSELVKKEFNEIELANHKFFLRFKSFPVLIARLLKNQGIIVSRNKWLITFNFSLEDL